MADLRETLIGAAAAEVHRAACGCDGSLHSRDEYDCLYRGRAVAALSGALPLIADYIEDELTRPYKVPGDPESYFATTDTWNNAVGTAAHRIRMLVPGSTERI